jgi:hypothetical protein
MINVKQLEWGCAVDDHCFIAETSIGSYYAMMVDGKEGYFSYRDDYEGGLHQIGVHSTIDDAKVACQKDAEKRIGEMVL